MALNQLDVPTMEQILSYLRARTLDALVRTGDRALLARLRPARFTLEYGDASIYGDSSFLPPGLYNFHNPLVLHAYNNALIKARLRAANITHTLESMIARRPTTLTDLDVIIPYEHLHLMSALPASLTKLTLDVEIEPTDDDMTFQSLLQNLITPVIPNNVVDLKFSVDMLRSYTGIKHKPQVHQIRDIWMSNMSWLPRSLTKLDVDEIRPELIAALPATLMYLKTAYDRANVELETFAILPHLHTLELVCCHKVELKDPRVFEELKEIRLGVTSIGATIMLPPGLKMLKLLQSNDGRRQLVDYSLAKLESLRAFVDKNRKLPVSALRHIKVLSLTVTLDITENEINELLTAIPDDVEKLTLHFRFPFLIESDLEFTPNISYDFSRFTKCTDLNITEDNVEEDNIRGLQILRLPPMLDRVNIELMGGILCEYPRTLTWLTTDCTLTARQIRNLPNLVYLSCHVDPAVLEDDSCYDHITGGVTLYVKNDPNEYKGEDDPATDDKHVYTRNGAVVKISYRY